MTELFNKIFSNLGDNPYFGAGFGLVGVGAGLAATRQFYSIGLLVFKRHCMTTLEITHRDQAYSWVLNWLIHHHKTAQHLGVVTQVYRKNSGQFSTKFNYVPCVGTHFLRFRNKWLKVERERQQTISEPFETIKFTCLGRNRQIFSDMLDYATDLELSQHEGKTIVYEPKSHMWEPIGEPRRQRDFSSVILDENISESILSDVSEFLKSREWYDRRGIPYRRGYLLHGPPGCGKTSYITALAGKLDYDICQLSLSDFSLADDRLRHFMNVAPPNSIILLEDIDAAFVDRENIDYSSQALHGMRKLTLSGILNVIDGAASAEERLIFMTTNYPEKLDAALTRPGRVDMKVYIGYASMNQLERLFNKFYPTDTRLQSKQQPQGADFVSAVVSAARKMNTSLDNLKMSMAEVQSYFLLYKDQPEGATNNVLGWIDKQSKNDRKSQNIKPRKNFGKAP